MAKKTSKEPPVAKQKKLEKKLYRCIAVNTVTAAAHEYSRGFGPGQIVDLEESIGGGLKLRDVIRPGTFEAVDSATTDEGDNR